jgi:hypothetical protein
MRKALFVFLVLTLSACSIEQKKGILVDVEPGTPMDESDLHQHCDLGDQAACALFGAQDAPSPTPRFAILQGIAAPDSAVFAALVPKGTKLAWYLYDRELSRLTRLFTPLPVSRGKSRWALQRLQVKGLVAGRTYELLAGDPEGHLLEDRTFRPLRLDERALRVALLGGLRLAEHAERARLFEEAMARDPQLLVLSGDAVDATLPAKQASLRGKAASDFFFERHAEARASLELAFARSLLPVTDLWNDAEYGQAGGDRSFPQRDQAREALEQFFPEWADEDRIVDGPGIAKAIDFRAAELALVDDITFRQPPAPGEPVCHKARKRKKEVCRPGAPIPAPPGTRYGSIQVGWIADRATKTDLPLWLLAGEGHLLPYEPGWADSPVLSSRTLTHRPAGAWLSLVESTAHVPPHVVPAVKDFGKAH